MTIIMILTSFCLRSSGPDRGRSMRPRRQRQAARDAPARTAGACGAPLHCQWQLGPEAACPRVVRQDGPLPVPATLATAEGQVTQAGLLLLGRPRPGALIPSSSAQECSRPGATGTCPESKLPRWQARQNSAAALVPCLGSYSGYSPSLLRVGEFLCLGSRSRCCLLVPTRMSA
jgi:hypothetical protein